jgi:hypothetical protein
VAHEGNPAQELTALQTIIGALQVLDADAQQRIFSAAATFLQLEQRVRDVPRESSTSKLEQPASGHSYPEFANGMPMSPKEFLLQKQPRSDVERIAVLAFYLMHYRDTPHFKTLDLSKLNTEAAQPKFSNAANSANNAVKQGYIVPSIKGSRQLSAPGERFVTALPDREAARQAMNTGRPRRRTRRARPAKKTSED